MTLYFFALKPRLALTLTYPVKNRGISPDFYLISDGFPVRYGCHYKRRYRMCRCAAHNRLGELIKGIVGVGDGSCRRSFRQLIAISIR